MAESEYNGKPGKWRTVKGRKVFFPDGEDEKAVLSEAFGSDYKPSKKRIKNGKFEKSDDGENWDELEDTESYNDYYADEDEFDLNEDGDFEERMVNDPNVTGSNKKSNSIESIKNALEKEPNLSLNGYMKEYNKDENIPDFLKSIGLENSDFKGTDALSDIYEALNESTGEKPEENTQEIPLKEESINKKPHLTTEELNRRTMRSSQMGQMVQNARKNGQTPQQVLDSVAYDMDIEPGSEEYETLKSYVMHDTRLNKESGQYEYNRFNIGSNKLLNKPEDRAKMEQLSDALKQAGLDNKVEDGYEDYGANMQWTNITSDGTWVLNPREWMDYMNGNKSLEETVDSIVNGEYGVNSGKSVFKWNKPQAAAAGGGMPPDDDYEAIIKEYSDARKSNDLQKLALARVKLMKYLESHDIEPQKGSPKAEFDKKR